MLAAKAAQSIHERKVTESPQASTHTSKPFPLVIFIASSLISNLPELIVPVAPKCIAFSNLPSKTSATYTSAPCALAAISANNPIGPAPTTSTLSPL